MSVFQPADKRFLYVSYRDAATAKWVKKATQFLPGQEMLAQQYLDELQGNAPSAKTKFTVQAWANQWLNDRSEQVRDYKNDLSRLKHHVLPTIGHRLLDEIRPADLVRIVEEMKKKDLAPRTIRNTYSVIQAMWRDARLMDLTQNDPCILTARQLGKVKDKDLGWRGQAVFTRAEVIRLIGDDKLPFHRRVLYGLLAVGMLRDGEAAGLRWRRVSLTPEPLGRITVVASYDQDTTKTDSERWMPIHPTLNTILYVWKTEGWAQEMGRGPTDEDLVVPAPKPVNRGPRKQHGAMLDKNYVWKRFASDLKTLGFKHRRVHDLRRTGISLSIEDGADELMLKRGTHAAPKSVMGMYTTVSWERLCEEVEKLKLERREPKRFGPEALLPAVRKAARKKAKGVPA